MPHIIVEYSKNLETQIEIPNMLHATLLLLEGRDDATKKQYGDILHATLKQAAATLPDCATTLEIRDMAEATYYM